ncbi:MAG: hypothetical protein M0T70_02200 [Geobacteraceae bacterium]|nr:hypothetical protein [Geobacteraceae bacterium]
MKRILCATLLAMVLAAPAFAAKLYLKDGGFIQAKRVWRAGGRVYVLATRDTMTSFEPSEVNLKRTFVKRHQRHRVRRHISAVLPQAHAIAAAPNGAAANQKEADKKAGIIIRSMPEQPTDSSTPSRGGGSIKQYRKEMSERLAE